ncbi:MAG TPA: hypothetical protein VH165_24060, partial [Kofleriaceae bacterium]|nr:hypothetical protein [Kofleriaceae bacterium]
MADVRRRQLRRIRRIEDTPNITLHVQTEIIEASGDDHLEQVTWRDATTGAATTHRIRHVFMMIGAMPNTEWLAGCVEV